MKSKDTDFPDSLLQQFNFGGAEEAAAAEESEDTAGKKKESEKNQ